MLGTLMRKLVGGDIIQGVTDRDERKSVELTLAAVEAMADPHNLIALEINPQTCSPKFPRRSSFRGYQVARCSGTIRLSVGMLGRAASGVVSNATIVIGSPQCGQSRVAAGCGV
ncbi:hypothetical protein ATK86_7119 [Nocardia fluminea]|uniref:Uncharacterized protein n=1 Tax=Nocardia fluminea TaxID=134984 RepID=A0A2N3V506_9NOCA|nr:hypothetical protein ATK86_7119 [Nocardia fluminea]